MNRADPLLLPVFFAGLVHVAIFILMFSFVSSGGDFQFNRADLSKISINARVVTLPTPKKQVVQQKVAKPKPQVQPQPASPALQEEIKEEPVKEKETENVAEETSLTGTRQEQEISVNRRNEALAYYGRNKDLVERNFYAGTGAQREQFEGLVTRLKLYLDNNGRLEDIEIISGSGNNLFDSETIRAVRRVSKFIIPDDLALRQRYFRQLVIEFKLD